VNHPDTNATVIAAERPPALSVSLVLSVFLPFAAGYFLSYLFRTINAVIAPDLVADAGLSASALGLLTSVYFLAFALLQLPLGLVLDRFGPRKVAAGLLLVAALGSLVFALAQGAAGLTVGRALIGAGVSCCMMASFKAFALWFPPRRLPLVNGCLLACGALGALAATAPTQWLLGMSGWRALFVGLALATLLAAVAVHRFVPEHDEAPGHVSLRAQLAGLGGIFRDPVFWRVAPVAAISSGASQSVLGLWAGPWLRDVVGLGRVEIADHLLISAAAMGVGFLTMGALTERLSRAGIKPLWVVGGVMSGFMLMLAVLAAGVTAQLSWLLIGLGFLATGASLNYALLSQHFGRQLAGRANTALNLLVFVAAFAMQWAVGVVIGWWEDPLTQQYAAVGYRVAFGSLAGMQALALLWLVGRGGDIEGGEYAR